VPRKRCRRRIGFFGEPLFFRPFGSGVMDEVVLGFDEIEALRLKDLLLFPQDEAARVMNVSQPTFHRLLREARRKIADALVHGKAIRVEGGSFIYDPSYMRPCFFTKERDAICEELSLEAEEEIRRKGIKGGEEMKIAITSTGDTLESPIDERFGRARKIIIYDTENGTYSVLDNAPNLSLSQGAGIQTARKVIDQGVKAVISGHFGPNAVRVLSSAQIELYQALGMTAHQAVERFKENKLQRLYGPDKEAHW